MKLAIICSTYKRGRSYQENVWAEEFAKRGHEVRVVSAATEGPQVNHVAVDGGSYEERFVPTRILPHGTFLSKHVVTTVRDFKPDMIWICGNVNFAKKVATDPTLRSVPLANFFSENLSWHEFDWRKPGIGLAGRIHALGYYTIRGAAIRAICRRSDLVIANVPQGVPIILRAFAETEKPAIQQKMVSIPLGFDPTVFALDPDLRAKIRAEFGVGPRDVLLAATSRMEADKLTVMLTIVKAFHNIIKAFPALRATVVGFSDTPESQAVMAAVKNGPSSDAIIPLDWADRPRMNELFNAADIAVFGRSSISAQEALATGVQMILPNDNSLSHVVRNENDRILYQPDDASDLVSKLGFAIDKLIHTDFTSESLRSDRAAAARSFGYDKIIDRVLNELATRTGGNQGAAVKKSF